MTRAPPPPPSPLVLQKHLQQPAPSIKEVLAQCAILNKRGPLKDQWTLRASYETPGGASGDGGGGGAAVKQEGATG